MCRRKIIALLTFLFLPQMLWADTIYLKDGTVVEGKIVEKKNYATKVMVNGHLQVFYSGQIERMVEDAAMGEEVNLDLGTFEGISKEKVKLIVNLLKANGLTATLQKSIEDAIKSAPAERREEFKTLFDFNELLKILIPIYDLYYSESELKELAQIYDNPVRKKEIENTPAIVKEALTKIVQYVYQKSQGTELPLKDSK